MKVIGNIARAATLTTLLTLAGVCASASQFHVNLPCKAHWGSAVLAPGDYTVTYSQAEHIVRVSGHGKRVTVLVRAISDNKGSGRAELGMITQNGEKTVTTLSSVSTGETLVFDLPKEKES